MAENGTPPDGWTATTLGTVLTDIQPGFAAGKHSSDGVGLAHLRPMNVSRDGRIDLSDLRSIDPSLANKPTRRLRRGDVLFNNTNSLELVGKTALFDGDDDPAFSNHMTRLRVDPAQADPAFVAALLHERWRAGEFRQLANNHVSQASVGRAVLASLPIALPPIPAQHSIAELVAEINVRRASIKDRLAAARAIVDRLRAAVVAAACSGRLTADWRSEHNASPVDEGPALSAQAARHGSGADNTPEFTDIPASWAWWSVESITSAVIDYRGRTPPTSSDGTIPHVRTTQIRDGRIDWNADRFVTEDTYDRYMTRGMPKRGDVLFTMEAPLGEVGVIDTDDRFSIAQRILLLSPAEGVVGDFLALALQSPAVRRAIELRSTGTGVSGIAYKRLRSVLIPRPPAGEQAEIVERAKAALGTADRLCAGISAAEVALQRSARGALAHAFRGELVPHSLDSDLV